MRSGGVSTGCLLVFSLFAALSEAQAGTLIGGASGNDNGLNTVNSVITVFNNAHDPDLLLATALFKKSDSDSSFVFNPANGFTFYSDAAGTHALTTQAALASLSTAYFSYTGLQPLAYYSVKAANEFKVYTFTPGTINLLTSSSHNISHVSFWTGPSGVINATPTATSAPEPASLVLWGVLGLVGVGCARRRAA